MKTAKNITLPSVYTAILIGGQFVLSGISGIEIVTVLLLAFCYKYGVKQGLFVANAFSLLRCFLFGFYLNVLILYFVYYNTFVIVFGLLGKVFNNSYGIKSHIVILVVAMIMTASFTLFDNVLTPLIYGFSRNATKAYFLASLYTVVPQIMCTMVTVTFLFPLIIKVLPKNN